jgi:hypothetical protein
MGQRKHEAPEIGAMVRRMVRALVRRAAEGDTEALEQLALIEKTLPASITEAGRAMHDEFGYSYTFLGDTLGVTRQAARQRFNVEPTTDPKIR